MKIDRTKSLRQNLHMNRKVDKEVKAPQGAFKKVLREAKETDITERLDQLMEVIEDKAKKLKKNLTLQNLNEYRHHVKQFLKLFNEEFMHANQTVTWNRGSMKSFTILQEIDESLETLRSLFMEEQKDSLKIVNELDAIRGMLMDLYV